MAVCYKRNTDGSRWPSIQCQADSTTTASAFALPSVSGCHPQAVCVCPRHERNTSLSAKHNYVSYVYLSVTPIWQASHSSPIGGRVVADAAATLHAVCASSWAGGKEAGG